MTPHTDNVVERPADLTAAWLTAAIGAGDITDFTVERIGTGQMSECYRVQLQLRRRRPRTDRPGLGGAEGRGHRPDEPSDRDDAGPLRARSLLLPRYRATAAGPGRAVLPHRFRRVVRDFRRAARRCESCCRRR